MSQTGYIKGMKRARFNFQLKQWLVDLLFAFVGQNDLHYMGL
ncbi:hypothetical protein PRUB_b0992 [Pseudoalteromonas rubra]|uniref:Uncharacterized protein n=1 Tax=Pseudoalteromonas rubra TaxID=43658 RepID=A0A8T0C180_9GAMM|nr:hypothetical protein PRUB_b0992 [Pseudoalteromonas rubra]